MKMWNGSFNFKWAHSKQNGEQRHKIQAYRKNKNSDKNLVKHLYDKIYYESNKLKEIKFNEKLKYACEKQMA